MIRHTVFAFPRTIYQRPDDATLPLGPWSSLNPDIVYRQLFQDIALTFRKNGRLQVSPPPQKLENALGCWALALPRHSYTPPDFPHFQLWYINKTFTPSFGLLPSAQWKMLAEITAIVKRSMQAWWQLPESSFFFGINSTPFSFVRRPDGLYWPGGQSVRTFHLSYLCLPRESLMEKVFIPENKLGLVYPLNFSRELLKFWLRLANLQAFIFNGESYRHSFDDRGLIVDIPGSGIESFANIWALINRIDKIAYQVQLVVIYALYKRSKRFLDNLDGLLSANDVRTINKFYQQLSLGFEGRPLKKSQSLLLNGLLQLDSKYGSLTSRPKSNWDSIQESLIINRHGQPASFVSQRQYVLRPGMGYGYLAKISARGINLRVMPLDTLLPKGMVEAYGYSFQKKIIRHSLPLWFKDISETIFKNMPGGRR